MGIPLIPAETNNACPSCFPVDETPVVVYVTFTGLQKGSLWASYMGNPPNGVHMLTNTGACFWELTQGLFHYSYHSGSPPRFLLYDYDGFINLFIKVVDSSCVTYFPNPETNPTGAIFWGGHASITYTAPAIGASCLLPADLMVIHRDPKTFAEVFPVDADNNVYRYARKKDATNVKILFDRS